MSMSGRTITIIGTAIGITTATGDTMTIGVAGIGVTATGITGTTAGITGAIASPRSAKSPSPKERGFFIVGRADQCRASAAGLSDGEGTAEATGLSAVTAAAGFAAACFPNSGFRWPSMKAPDSILTS